MIPISPEIQVSAAGCAYGLAKNETAREREKAKSFRNHLIIELLQCSFSERSMAQGAMFLAFGEGQASCGEFLRAVEGERRARNPGDPVEGLSDL